MKIYDIPKTRDPFINTPLTPAGIDPITGEERFFISTWNSNTGCLGALVTENECKKIYRFKKVENTIIYCGAYSAVCTDNDTMWLISDLQAFVRLTLSTGEYEVFYTGARSGLVFAGMQYNKETQKLLAFAFAYPCLCGVSFDIEKKTTCKIYENFTKATIAHGGFRNVDGTHTVRFTTEYSSLYRWNPYEETLEELFPISADASMTKSIVDPTGRVYVPYEGWLDTSAFTFDKSSAPRQEAIWFSLRNGIAYGYKIGVKGCEIFRWDTKSGDTKFICSAPDGGACDATKNGNIIDVNLYGQVYVFSPEGKLINTYTLDSDAIGHVDCLTRVGDRFLLGTPFITQRFWLIDTVTGKSFDAGRASPGLGEVLRVWHIDGKAYMASYTEGVLTEFDPERDINFPENPRVVASPEHAMRPVADAKKGNTIYYASNHHYGIIGCVLSKYDTVSEEELHIDDPLYAQHIISLRYDKSRDILIGSTTYMTDCNVTAPKSDLCYVLEIDCDTLEIKKKTQAPEGTSRACVLGMTETGSALVMFCMRQGGPLFGEYDGEQIRLYNRPRYDESLKEIIYTGNGSEYILRTGDTIYLAELREERLVLKREIMTVAQAYLVVFCDGYVYCVTKDKIYEKQV